MQINDLYEELRRAYSVENLNDLSSGIIALYRKGDIASLRKIHSIMYNGNQGEDHHMSRIFARIITHYHPDRQEQINKDLLGFLEKDDFAGMQQLDHILDIQKIDLSSETSGYGFDGDFDFEEVWEETFGAYTFIDDEEREESEYDPYEEMIMSHGFISAVKRKVYGHLNVEFPVHLLADMEIIEMSEYEIENLDGIEYCTYARIIDLSGNNLIDVSALGQLMRLEEVFLQNNHISYLDGLTELPYLRVLDLSYNDVDDISPLFEIDTLEFLNIIGNRVPAWQLEHMSLSGVVVVA